MSNLKRLLNSVGKNSFVAFYEDYKGLYLMGERITQNDKLLIARKLLKNNPIAEKESGQITRINAAIRIFKNGWEKAALEEIKSSNHFKVTKETKEKARSLLKK